MIYGVKAIARNALGLSSRSDRLYPDEFWALDGISFEVKKGEITGIIGPNGSGKTTLLKMLNGIFWPDRGRISIRGRVGALIEVGAGFHPLLTGRENIYVNAAILGMNRTETDRKFQDIVDFADIGDFIDSPVKYYSSGMFVRLGFAIAVHCEPDIMLIDEILAVGDSDFQNKCLQKLAQIKERMTVVIVSHNLNTIRLMTDRCIFLHHGRIVEQDDTASVLESYARRVLSGSNAAGMYTSDHLDIAIKDAQGKPTDSLHLHRSYLFDFTVKDLSFKEGFLAAFSFVHLNSSFSHRVEIGDLRQVSGRQGKIAFSLAIDDLCLPPGEYSIRFAVSDGSYLHRVYFEERTIFFALNDSAEKPYLAARVKGAEGSEGRE